MKGSRRYQPRRGRDNSASTSPFSSEGLNTDKYLFSSFHLWSEFSLFYFIQSSCLSPFSPHPSSSVSLSYLLYMSSTLSSVAPIAPLARSNVPAVYPVPQVADPAWVISPRYLFRQYDSVTKPATATHHRIQFS